MNEHEALLAWEKAIREQNDLLRAQNVLLQACLDAGRSAEATRIVGTGARDLAFTHCMVSITSGVRLDMPSPTRRFSPPLGSNVLM